MSSTEEATVRFEGKGFHTVEWEQILRDTGFRTSGVPKKSLYALGGNYIVGEEKGFVSQESVDGFEWHVTLRQTRGWEGTIKYYSILLAAFVVPQKVIVNVGKHFFTEQDTLRRYAEHKLLQEYPIDELIENRVYREGDGVQFI